MNILLIGSGGREHSIALKLSKSPLLTKLYIAPGNSGTSNVGENIPVPDSDIKALCTFAKEKNIDLTIVGPENPLVAGIVDLFNEHNLPIIGPSKKGAQLEGSKEWAKAFMKRHNIPTASYETFDNFENAKAHILSKNTYPIVIKADGLAAGKGVTVAESKEQAFLALEDCFVKNTFKEAGQKVVIESFLEGQEASIFAFTDGKTIIPMVPAQDHKAALDGDKGPNTGGMGAYSPAPIVTKEIEKKVFKTVFTPLLKGFQKENIDYKGIVYAGLMIKDNDVSIVEFNVRFGDPETQVVLPRLKTDLLSIFKAIYNQTLDSIPIEWNQNPTVCVVLASKGYPGSYEKGKIITGTDNLPDKVNVIHAGSRYDDDGNLVSTGGRVLGVIGTDTTLEKAIKKTYEGVSNIEFENKYNRTDIAQKAFKEFS